MSVPEFTAETSLYKSINLYCGYNGRTRLDTTSSVVAAASSCEIGCGVADVACLAGCSFLGPWAPLCWAGCQAATAICLLSCQEGGGSGGGGGGTPKTCCERNEWGRCIYWVPKGDECWGSQTHPTPTYL